MRYRNGTTYAGRRLEGYCAAILWALTSDRNVSRSWVWAWQNYGEPVLMHGWSEGFNDAMMVLLPEGEWPPRL